MLTFTKSTANTSSNGAKKVASPSCPANNNVNSVIFSDIASAMSVLFCLIMLISIMLNVIIIPCIMIIMIICKVKGKRHLKAASI